MVDTQQLSEYAQTKLQAAEAKLADVQSKLVAAQSEARKWREFVNTLEFAIKQFDEVENTTESSSSNQQPLTPLSAQDTADVVYDILKTSSPLQTGEILAQLNERGYEIQGQDPQATLFTRLNRILDLTHIRGEGWKRAPQPTVSQPTPSGLTTFNYRRRFSISGDDTPNKSDIP